MQVDSGLQTLEGMLSEGGVSDLSLDVAQEVLDHGSLLVEKLRQEYEGAKSVGKEGVLGKYVGKEGMGKYVGKEGVDKYMGKLMHLTG